jgi:hypothetical protein
MAAGLENDVAAIYTQGLMAPTLPSISFPPAQTDILSSPAEVEEVVGFVRSNAARVLQVDEPRVLAVR